jgi:3-hydroxyisobutyrate dehydrogenase-like beta-hydroxyacid dehydrogenase
MTTTTITVLHPGEMGASVAAAAASNGHRVRWVDAGRSAATRSRAHTAGLEACASLESALDGAAVVFSVCPPHAAVDTARAVAATGFAGLYVDGNAIAPATTRSVAAIVQGAGAHYVDGGIIGPPVKQAGTTRLFLSGPHAAESAALFGGSLLAAQVLEGPLDAASALKMCYAAWTKGTTALLAAIRALAQATQVEQALLAEWQLSQPGLGDRSERSVRANAFKAWRWIAEMHEIAASFEAEGLPAGFHRAAAEVYQTLEGFKDERDPSLDAVLEALLASRR